MGSVADRLRRASARHVLAPDGVVYKIRRVRSADLAEHAVVELVGGLEVQREIERIKKEQAAEAAEWKRDHVDPVEREEYDRKQAERENHAHQTSALAMARTVAKNPRLFRGWMERTDAYCCAGVIGAAVPDELPAEEPGAVEWSGPVDPLRLCMKEDQEDPDADRIWVGHLDQQTRQFLAEQVSELSGAPTVAPFRGST